ncbi:cupin domain-containing protein [Sesbania bispinosa]|nr:cupin domain-containing protein [Sesbania bispinosa]
MERLGEGAPRMQCSGEWRSSRCRSHGGNGWRAVVNGRGEAVDGTGGIRWWSCEQRRCNGEASDGLPLFSFLPFPVTLFYPIFSLEVEVTMEIGGGLQTDCFRFITEARRERPVRPWGRTMVPRL